MKLHPREYAIEGALLGLFMVSACGFTALLEHPASPLRAAIASGDLRRALIGLAMGLTAIALIRSPWGGRSGAHMNPAVTFAFWRLGKVGGGDALGYVAGQFAGGAAGVAAMAAVLPAWVRDPAVNYVVTAPGAQGIRIAWTAEFIISFVMMTTVLFASNHPRLSKRTPLLAGALVALYIAVEAPLSGMSMNPARSFGSAVSAMNWTAIWIYFTAPVLGMLAASELYVRTMGGLRVYCAKLNHHNQEPCIFRCRFGELNAEAER